MKQTPRAIRNNNWLNIVYNPRNQWKGLAIEKNDGRFCIFAKPEYGLRAAFKLILEAYYNNLYPRKQWTIEGIVNRWAPASENNVNAYVNDVIIYLHDKGFRHIADLTYTDLRRQRSPQLRTTYLPRRTSFPTKQPCVLLLPYRSNGAPRDR